MRRACNIIRTIGAALNPFGPASGDWHSIEVRHRDRDGAEGGDANAAPVPKDRQARAEGIAQNPTGSTS